MCIHIVTSIPWHIHRVLEETRTQDIDKTHYVKVLKKFAYLRFGFDHGGVGSNG